VFKPRLSKTKLAGRDMCRDVVLRRRTRAHAPVPRRPRHAQPEVPPTEAAASLGTRAPVCLVFSSARVASPPRRKRASHRADRWSDPHAAIRASTETLPYHGDISTLVTLPSSPVDRPAYKRRLGLPAGGHRATGRHCRPRAELGPFPRNRVDPPASDRP
jgi:hypothetical protein